jgi:hypothetical protein
MTCTRCYCPIGAIRQRQLDICWEMVQHIIYCYIGSHHVLSPDGVWLFTLGTPMAPVTINRQCVSNCRDVSYCKRVLDHDAVPLQSIGIRLDCEKQNSVLVISRRHEHVSDARRQPQF